MSTDTDTPVVETIQVGLPADIATSDDTVNGRPWRTAIFKHGVAGPIRMSCTNLAGDGQADLRVHGGADKAVCAYPIEHYTSWNQDLPDLAMSSGAFGENFTVRRLTETAVCIGDIYEVGTTVIQVSQPRSPCWKLARRWDVKDLAVRTQQTGRTGWYFRVLAQGTVEPGQPMKLTSRPHPRWTIHRVNQARYGDNPHPESVGFLASCVELSQSWRTALNKLQRHVDE